MIYITGDTHGEQSRMKDIFSNSGITWTTDDYLIVCGDFGYIFTGKEYEETFLNDLEKLCATILFIDGNHENFDLLCSHPLEMWNGGKIHRIRRNVIHLMRGQVFTIEGSTFFTMGGGFSIDKYLRQENISWWPQEMPSKEEYDEAVVNLKKHGNKVDYILTHTVPTETLIRLNLRSTKELPFNTFLDYIQDITEYKHWYFGHLHRDGYIWRNQTGLYFDVITIDVGDIPRT